MASKTLREIEYAGYLLGSDPVRISTHPVFNHIKLPPEGYKFTQNSRSQDGVYAEILKYLIESQNPNVDSLAHQRVLGSLVKDTIKYGGTIEVAQDFLKDRQLNSQTQLPEKTNLAFIPTVPYAIGLTRWVIEIEDSTTLFCPYLLNGQTASCEVSENKFFPALKALLESDSCQGIITHVKSTADSLPKLFKSDNIGKKTVHSPLGVELPDLTGKKTITDNSCINLLFTNSWHQLSGNFYLRGGHDVLEAFAILAERYSHVNLILRTRLPELNKKQANLVANHPRIKLIDKFLRNEELHDLMLNTDIYLIPAARIHVMSTLKALSYGIPVIATDGWAFSEYIDDGRNGILVPGRYGLCSWIDENNGMLREDYSSIAHPNGSNPNIVAGIVKAVSDLIENPHKRQQMSDYARFLTETKFTIAQWNETLKITFDRILDNEEQQARWKRQQAEIEQERKQFILNLETESLSSGKKEAIEKVIPLVMASKIEQEAVVNKGEIKLPIEDLKPDASLYQSLRDALVQEGSLFLYHSSCQSYGLNIQGHNLPQNNSTVLESLLRKIATKQMKVVEIGSWKGMATAVMGGVLSEYEGTLFAIDTWKGSSSVPSMEWEAGNTDIFNIFIDNMKLLGLLNEVVKPIVMESTAAAQIFQDNSLDFIFIDGDHSYSSVKQDILVWLPKLKEGGTICGHCAEGYYSQYSEIVKAEIDCQCELDWVITEEGGVHPGVVKATYEVFGNKYEIMPGTSIWYYQKKAIDAQWSVGSSKPNKLNPYYAAHVKILLNILGETTQEDPDQGSIYQSERIFLIAQYCTQGWNGDLIQLGFQGIETTKKLAELAKKSHRRLVIVPLAEAETKEGSSNWEETLFKDIEQYRDVVSIIQSGSLTEDTIKSIQHQEFCFAFIDGFETYDTCLTAIKTVACCSGVIAVDNTSESQEISRAFLQGSEFTNRSKLYLPLCRESYLLWS